MINSSLLSSSDNESLSNNGRGTKRAFCNTNIQFEDAKNHKSAKHEIYDDAEILNLLSTCNNSMSYEELDNLLCGGPDENTSPVMKNDSLDHQVQSILFERCSTTSKPLQRFVDLAPSSDGQTPFSDSGISVQIIQKDDSAKAKLNPLSPNSVSTFAKSALFSKNTFNEERQHYVKFISRLDAVYDKSDEFEEDGDEEYIDEDVSLLDEEFQESSVQNSIPSKEILELFQDSLHYHRKSSTCNTITSMPKNDNLESHEIIDMLYHQINIHYQLIIQNLALSGEIVKADKVWVLALTILIDLEKLLAKYRKSKFIICASKGFEVFLKILSRSPIHNSLLQKLFNFKSDQDLAIKASVEPIDFILKYKEKKSPALSPSFWHIFSIFGDPYDKNYKIITRTMKNRLSSILRIDPQKGKRVDSFSLVEDQLLLLGLTKFGIGNWEIIKSKYLPTRSAKQLAIRYKNLTCRNAPSNKIKEFSQRLLEPLNEIEENLIKEGIKIYKFDWLRISTHFLPHRPAAVLRQLWVDRIQNK